MTRPFLIVLITILATLTLIPAASAQEACVDPNCVEVAYGIPEAEILAYPMPAVQPLLPDESLIQDRVYWRINSAIEVFDAPNGNLVSTLAAGFNFVTTLRVQDGWVEINPGGGRRRKTLGVRQSRTLVVSYSTNRCVTRWRGR